MFPLAGSSALPAEGSSWRFGFSGVHRVLAPEVRVDCAAVGSKLIFAFSFPALILVLPQALNNEKNRIYELLVDEHKRLIKEFEAGRSQYEAVKKELKELKSTASELCVFSFLSLYFPCPAADFTVDVCSRQY